MLYIIPAWLISLIAAYLLGFYVRDLKNDLTAIKQLLQSKVDKKPEVEEPKSILIDETDPVQIAMREREELMRKLNAK